MHWGTRGKAQKGGEYRQEAAQQPKGSAGRENCCQGSTHTLENWAR